MNFLKRALVVLFSFTTTAAFAETPKDFSFRCMTGLPTTTFILENDGDDVVLTVWHHNGVKFMPIHKGIITPHDLDYMARKADVLTKLPDITKFRFPRSKCRTYGDDLMSCASGDSRVFDGTKFTATYLNTTTGKERVFDHVFERTSVTLTLHIENFVPVQEITMDYAEGECKLSF